MSLQKYVRQLKPVREDYLSPVDMIQNILSEADGDSINLDSEVVDALIALGYSANEARQAVQASDSLASITLEEGIRNALMNLGR